MATLPLIVVHPPPSTLPQESEIPDPEQALPAQSQQHPTTASGTNQGQSLHPNSASSSRKKQSRSSRTHKRTHLYTLPSTSPTPPPRPSGSQAYLYMNADQWLTPSLPVSLGADQAIAYQMQYDTERSTRELSDRVGEVKIQVGGLKEHISTVGQDAREIRDQIWTVKEQIMTVGGQVGTVREQVGTIREQLRMTGKDVGTLREQVGATKHQVWEVLDEMKGVQRKLDRVEQNIDRRIDRLESRFGRVESSLDDMKRLLAVLIDRTPGR